MSVTPLIQSVSKTESFTCLIRIITILWPDIQTTLQLYLDQFATLMLGLLSNSKTTISYLAISVSFVFHETILSRPQSVPFLKTYPQNRFQIRRAIKKLCDQKKPPLIRYVGSSSKFRRFNFAETFHRQRNTKRVDFVTPKANFPTSTFFFSFFFHPPPLSLSTVHSKPRRLQG